MTTKEHKGEASRTYSQDTISFNRVFVERIINVIEGRVTDTDKLIVIAQLKDSIETLKKRTQLKEENGKLTKDLSYDDHEVLTHIRKISREYILKNQ